MGDAAQRRRRSPRFRPRLARGIDAVIVAPATANVIGKCAAGLADASLDHAVSVDRPGPPSSSSRMTRPCTTRRAPHRATLGTGYALLAPGEGALACGEVGVGRWPGNEPILAALDRLVNGRGRLAGRRVVVTAGPTQVDIDPVRVITNRSSGRMGFAIAQACWREGAEVTLIHGPTAIDPPPFVKAVAVRTPEEMAEAVRDGLDGADQLWMAARLPTRPVRVGGESSEGGLGRRAGLEPTKTARPAALEGSPGSR